MMEWHINDLSLVGNFSSSEVFIQAVNGLLEVRSKNPLLKAKLYCSKSLHVCEVIQNITFSQAVYSTNDQKTIRLVLAWVTKSGPFWDDSRQENQDDYFEYCTYDVTDQGLGEAARRKLAGTDAHTFSFKGFLMNFEKEKLAVQHGLTEQPIGFIEIHNFWDLNQILELLEHEKTYSCWQDVYNEVLNRFEGLIFLDDVIEKLKPFPFSTQVAKRIFELLDVLNTLYLESDDTGKLSQHGLDILNTYFVGEKAWFTDESATNKVNFKYEMSFSDPENINSKIFCPWHGKIKSPQIRIHFQWPRPEGQKKIKVLYIGPKITKK